MSARTWTCWSVLSLVLVAALPAAAADLTGSQWRQVYGETGGLVFFPELGQHYPTRWERGQIHAGGVALDMVQNQPHWIRLFDGSPPIGLVGGGVSGWASLSPRIRLGGMVRYIPRLDMWGANLGTAVQILDGSAENGAFFVGGAVGLLQTPDFRLVAPHLFVEWSGELFRTSGQDNAPWVVYWGARLDQGYRFVAEVDPRSVRNDDIMNPLLRGNFRLRRGNWQVAYSFGAQEARTYLHGVNLSYFFLKDRALRPPPEEAAPDVRERLRGNGADADPGGPATAPDPGNGDGNNGSD